MTTRVRCHRGYTVAELLVTAAVIALIMAGLFSLLVSGQQSYLAGANRAEAQQSMRLVLNRMLQELRTAGHDPSRSGAFAAVTALPAGTGFVLRNDWNGNGVIEPGIAPVTIDSVAHGEQITYTFTGTTLTRQESSIDGAPVTVTTAVNSIAIQYLDADDVAVPTPSGANASLVRSVVIDLAVNPDTVSASTLTSAVVSTRTRVRIRNQ